VRKRTLNTIGLICGVLALITAVAGRIATIHLTEGEALIAAWRYWASVAILAAMAGLIINKGGGQ